MTKLDLNNGTAAAENNQQKRSIESYRSSGLRVGLTGDIAIHAPPAFGKSFLAATASAHWPKERLGTQAVSLSDVIWCAVDRGAVDGLLMSKVNVPYLIDVRSLCEDFGAAKGTEHANTLVEATIKENPDVRVVVWDTISELDKVWQVELERTGGDEDSQWLYRKLLSRHRSHYSSAHKAALGRRVLWLAHSAAITEARRDAPKSVEAQRRATRLPGGAEIKLDATGKGHDLYINNASLVLTIVIEEAKGKPTQRFVTSGGTSFETKNRLQGLVKDRDVFDLSELGNRVDSRLGEIRAELTAAMAVK